MSKFLVLSLFVYDHTFDDSVVHALGTNFVFVFFFLNVISVRFKPRPKYEIYYKNYPFNLLL